MIQIQQKKRSEFVDSIKEDVKWLGCRLEGSCCILHPIILIRCMNAAVKLIKKGKAYVCDLTCRGDQGIPRDIERAWKGKPIQ